MGAMVRKEFAQLRRDRRTTAMLVMVPLLLLIVFGYAARFDVGSVRTVVVGPSADVVAATLPDPFDVRHLDPSGDERRARLTLRQEDVDAVVLADDGRVLVDGTQLSAAQLVLRAAEGSGGRLQAEVLFNPSLDTPTVIIPGLIGLIMLFVGALATSLGVVRERQAGTLEQLAVMPFRPIDVVVGKLAPYLVIAVLDMVVIVVIGLGLFDVPFEGSVAVFGTGAVTFLLVCLSIGVLISTVSENQGQAVQLSLLVLLPQVMLSGLLFPTAAMARPLQVVARVLPLTWFNELARGVMLRGATAADVAGPLLVMAGMAALVLSLAIVRFRRDLSPVAS